MSDFRDLEGEFPAVKQCTIDELDNNKLILSLKNQKGLVRGAALQRDRQKLNFTFNLKMNRFSRQKELSRPKDPKNSIEKIAQENAGQAPHKKRRIYLVGIDELKKTLEKNQQSLLQTLKHELESNGVASSSFNSNDGGRASDSSSHVLSKSSTPKQASKKKKSQMVLIPMDPEYIAKARAAFEKANIFFDASQPIEVETDSGDDQDDENDVFVDAPLQFREIEVSYDDLNTVHEASSPSQVVSANLDDDEPQTLSERVDTTNSESIQFCKDDVDLMRKTVLAQLVSPTVRNIEESLLAQPYKELHSILSRTLEDGESHMALLIGPQGLGKTVITEQAINDLKLAHNDNFITIRLSGSLHSTEQHAVREIARQLDLALKTEGSTESSTFEKRAISDTFANILLTLEAPTEAKKSESASKELPMRVIFVIDEIDKYTDTPKQMLLYNLFELTQNPNVPICVLGSTTKLNIRDLFEKRVRSRFSQRIITTCLADSIETFWENASSALKVANEESIKFADALYCDQWNQSIDKLFSGKLVMPTLYQCYFTTKSIGQFKQICMLPVSQIQAQNPFPNANGFEIYSRSLSDGVEAKIAACSRLELMMVVAAARWVHRSENSNVNFNLAYNEYEQMLKAHNRESTTLLTSGSGVNSSHIDSLALAGIKVTKSIYSVPIMRDCWGRIYRTGLLLDAITSSNEMNAHNNLNMYKEVVIEDSRMLQLDILLEEIRMLVAGDSLMERLSKI